MNISKMQHDLTFKTLSNNLFLGVLIVFSLLSLLLPALRSENSLIMAGVAIAQFGILISCWLTPLVAKFYAFFFVFSLIRISCLGYLIGVVTGFEHQSTLVVTAGFLSYLFFLFLVWLAGALFPTAPTIYSNPTKQVSHISV